MKALTIRQPYATAITHGLMFLTNNSWKMSISRPFTVAIYAPGRSKRLHLSVRVQRHLSKIFPQWRSKLAFGAIVGSARLVSVVPFRDPSVRSNPFATGPYCWRFDRPDLLPEPIPYRTERNGMWTLPDGIYKTMFGGNKPIQLTCECGNKAVVMITGSVKGMQCLDCSGLATFAQQHQQQ